MVVGSFNLACLFKLDDDEAKDTSRAIFIASIKWLSLPFTTPIESRIVNIVMEISMSKAVQPTIYDTQDGTIFIMELTKHYF